ncbi:Glycerol-3-phosphate O-acyltransferase PlsY [Candidatus Glomeribacter gigasporarum BEG34]|uniref:Glycerol-3-phosphate acyltransferase n=1 Tax=Candidatus Glomeribacter gigasporarum BEG34 TaxID=1070319 RepID=G2JAE1_9BURK|nr:glycerol-3-phosphate 1-O-acyltransferase PlsY [Candidatus Glomeribacter gigasporarum]CCD29742.1 Glycerol-3-phosphate O-acyltransferase PlsY [Candidatus Glomeribacter gigasporarum BEG34]
MMYLSVALFAYLIGSAPFALVVSKAMKLADPRSYGSGNPGATNVLRSGSLRAAALTFAGDAGKGGLAVWVAACALRRFGASSGLGNEVIALAALSVFMGHVWPVFFRFRGGRGVSTAAGILFAIHPALGAASAATWCIIAFFFRYSSLAALVTAVFAPLYQMLIFGPNILSAALIIISGILVFRHRSNIHHLCCGTEPRIGQKADE